MVRRPGTGIRIPIALVVVLITMVAAARAADDTARFYGTWETVLPINGKMTTFISVHDASGFKNFVRLPNGNAPTGEGAFSAANGRYTTSDPSPNDSGSYKFIGETTVICTNAAGQSAIWKRIAAPAPNAVAVSAPHAAVVQRPVTAPQGSASPGLVQDPSLPPDTNAAIAAFDKKDYNTAWRYFMASAQKGDAEAEAGVGAMLLTHLNPPGTGYYAQCEKWLQASANQGNPKGMVFLGKYYFESAAAIAGGINPGVNHAAVPPALQKQADDRFAMARQWYERAVAKNDVYAMGSLAVMLDAGVGGPRDPGRAAELRERVKHGSDANFAKLATTDPGNLALKASWQSGHYADAIRNAQARAAQGDASAEALLGRAYYEGLGVPRSYPNALLWLNKAEAQNNPDAMFFLGLMFEYGRGVGQDIDRAVKLFDRAAAQGQRSSEMEVAGMRMQGAAARQAALSHGSSPWENTACAAAGGTSDGGYCYRGAETVDPSSSTEFH
jgi:TPR repeat protein